MIKIILLGYMGSGKSTIAKLLANQLQIPFQDLDKIIESEQQMSIPVIFETKGEIYFRKLEHLALKKSIESASSFVMSLGGGTPCYANNHEFLKGESIVSVYLKTSIDELFNRLSYSKTKRPLIEGKSPAELKDFIAQHLFERSYYYHQASHTITTDGKSPNEIVAAIENLLI